jgi:hypothetical protein
VSEEGEGGINHLDVTMDGALLVDIFQSLENLFQDGRNHRLIQALQE